MLFIGFAFFLKKSVIFTGASGSTWTHQSKLTSYPVLFFLELNTHKPVESSVINESKIESF